MIWWRWKGVEEFFWQPLIYKRIGNSRVYVEWHQLGYIHRVCTSYLGFNFYEGRGNTGPRMCYLSLFLWMLLDYKERNDWSTEELQKKLLYKLMWFKVVHHVMKLLLL